MNQTTLTWAERETPSARSQSGRILAHFKSGHSLTPLGALDRFGCMRLGARVWDLRRMGWPIKERRLQHQWGKSFSCYWLERGDGKD